MSNEICYIETYRVNLHVRALDMKYITNFTIVVLTSNWQRMCNS
jgi:hypothetical protein